MKAEIQSEYCVGIVPESDAERAALQNVIDAADGLIYWGDIRIDDQETVGFKVNFTPVPAAL